MKSNELERKRDHIYIVPTRYGFLYGAIVFAFLIAGTSFENTFLLFATAILVTFGLVCMHQTHYNVAHVKIARIELESGFSGQLVSWKIRMLNDSPVPAFSINIRDAVIDVPIGDNFIENIPVILRKRGLVKLEDLKISSTYPFGLFYAWKWWRGNQSYYVYPALLANVSVPAVRGKKQSDLDGREDFVGHREYVPGDSAHRIDWKAQARRQKLMIKLFDTQSPESVVLDWYETPGNDIEERLSMLATLSSECFKLQKSFSLVMPTKVIPAKWSRSHYEECLRTLAVYKAENAKAA